MTLKEAIEGVASGIGHGSSRLGVVRYKTKDHMTGKFEVSYGRYTPSYGSSTTPPVVARVEFRDGTPVRVYAIDKIATKAERAIIESIKFQEVAE